MHKIIWTIPYRLVTKVLILPQVSFILPYSILFIWSFVNFWLIFGLHFFYLNCTHFLLQFHKLIFNKQPKWESKFKLESKYKLRNPFLTWEAALTVLVELVGIIWLKIKRKKLPIKKKPTYQKWSFYNLPDFAMNFHNAIKERKIMSSWMFDRMQTVRMRS